MEEEPSTFSILRREQCRSLPLEKLYGRLEALERAESKDVEEIRRKYASEISDLQRQISSAIDNRSDQYMIGVNQRN
ncbi:hypothetical protein BC829DRAFT_401582 [Chytridium lagenaria]|nr:hypothetical protein BC829DRAFT_401582 [Chytridium lagenaria]